MPVSYSARTTPKPIYGHRAVQKKARRGGRHVHAAGNFAAYAGTSAEDLEHVLIFDFEGNKLAGPLDLEAADAWLAQEQLDRLSGGLLGGGS